MENDSNQDASPRMNVERYPASTLYGPSKVTFCGPNCSVATFQTVAKENVKCVSILRKTLLPVALMDALRPAITTSTAEDSRKAGLWLLL